MMSKQQALFPLFFRRLSPVLLGLMGCAVLCQCAGNSDSSAQEIAPRQSKTIEAFMGGYEVSAAEDGTPTMTSSRRSMYDKKSTATLQSGRDYRGKNYTTNDYQSSRWGGNKTVNKKSYDRLDRSKHEGQSPWYLEKTANATGVQSRWDGNSYATKHYNTSSSRESTQDAYSTQSSYSTYRQPNLIPRVRGYQDNYTMSVDQMKAMLDR